MLSDVIACVCRTIADLEGVPDIEPPTSPRRSITAHRIQMDDSRCVWAPTFSTEKLNND